MIRHLSKTDHLGFSTNDALDSHDFPTLFFSAAHVAELVRVSPITVLFCPFSCSTAACEIICSLVGLLLSYWPLARTLPTCLLVGRLLAYCFTLLGIGALCILCRFFLYRLIASVEPVRITVANLSFQGLSLSAWNSSCLS